MPGGQPVGQKMSPSVPGTPLPPEHSMAGLDDATYLEVMEHDVLAVQSAIQGRQASGCALPAAPSAATRIFTERELAERRELPEAERARGDELIGASGAKRRDRFPAPWEL